MRKIVEQIFVCKSLVSYKIKTSNDKICTYLSRKIYVDSRHRKIHNSVVSTTHQLTIVCDIIIQNIIIYYHMSERLPFLLTGLWDVLATHCTRTCSRRLLSIIFYGCCGTDWSSSIRQSYFTTGYVNFWAIVHKFIRRQWVGLSNIIPTGFSNRAQ